jgi:hypothetical protein
VRSRELHVLAHGVLQRSSSASSSTGFSRNSAAPELEGAPAHLHRAVAGQHDDRLVDALRHQRAPAR